MIKKIKFKNKLLITVVSLGLTSTFFIVGTSCSNDSESRVKYNKTQESLEKIGDQISWKSFDVDTKINFNDVKANDIKWKDSYYYQDIVYKIIITEKLNEFHEIPNVVKFKIILFDKDNINIRYEPIKVFFIGHFA